MKHLIAIVLIALATKVLAQNNVYQFDFTGRSPLQMIEEIESKSGFIFYYAPEWLDSLKVQSRYFEGTLSSVLDNIFTNTRINYIILEDRIIMTYNSPILTQVVFDSTSSSDSDLSKYIFNSEYESNNQDIEEAAFIIGRKSEMQIGGTSLLSGFVKNDANGEPLGGTYLKSDVSATIADERGFFVLKVPNGKSVVNFQFGGMNPTQRTVVVFSDGSINVNMTPSVVMLDNLTIQANADENILSTQMGVYKFALDELKNIPKVFGENDILKVALALPGVQNVGEGSPGINVRGGKADQNLIMLDHATIYNPFHFFGFFSSFNAEALASTELYKNSMPASFGGRLSSVLDIRTREGSKEKFGAKGGIGLVTSSLNVEIPVVKHRTSLTLGGRSTYSDWILMEVDNQAIRNSKPFFYDLSGGIDHVYGRANHISVSGYYSYDQFKLSTDSLYSYSNFNFSLRWKHHINEKLSSEFTATSSDYKYSIDYNTIPESAFKYGFGINDMFSQLKFDYRVSGAHTIQTGVDGRLYHIDPGFRHPRTGLSEVPSEMVAQESGVELSYFIADNFTINEKWSLYGGVRYSGFAALGPAKSFIYESGVPKAREVIADSLLFKRNEIVKSYYGPEFRFSMRYSLDSKKSIKGAYNNTRQYLHSLSNSVSITPTDTWKLSDKNVLPQIAHQFSVGYFENFMENKIEASVEAYYKISRNLIDYKTNADLVLNKNLETDILQGDGRAYGVELFLRKSSGKLNGWLSYTYSRSLQRYASRFDEETINRGVYFPTNFDKPHILNLVGNYKLTKRYSFSFNANYSSGRPVTYPTAIYTIGGAPIIHFGERNRFRIPNYFRIDVGVNVEGSHKVKKLAHGYWSFSIYNLLGRDNPYSVFFRSSEGTIQAYRLAVLGSPIPSITYKFEF